MRVVAACWPLWLWLLLAQLPDTSTRQTDVSIIIQEADTTDNTRLGSFFATFSPLKGRREQGTEAETERSEEARKQEEEELEEEEEEEEEGRRGGGGTTEEASGGKREETRERRRERNTPRPPVAGADV